MANAQTRAITACRDPAGGAVQAALSGLGWALVGRAPEGTALLRQVSERQPDAVILDAILPGADGLAFIQRARRLKLNVQPAILLLVPRGLRLPGLEGLDRMGAMAAEATANAADLIPALEALRALPVPLPKEKAARLEGLLTALGVPEHPGRLCLYRAVELCWADRRRLNALRAALYPAIARSTGLTAEQVERAIRHVIDGAFRSGAIEEQHKIFGDTIDARRGKPTSGEMIAQLADILRWEG